MCGYYQLREIARAIIFSKQSVYYYSDAHDQVVSKTNDDDVGDHIDDLKHVSVVYMKAKV